MSLVFAIVGYVKSFPGVIARPSLAFSLSMSRSVTYTCAHSHHVTLSSTITTVAHKSVKILLFKLVLKLLFLYIEGKL